jgi:lipopolysaccharide biosynthesis regulator YciM
VPYDQAQFAKTYVEYAEAKKDGSLSAAECDSIAKGFQEVYENNKKSMLVARFNVGALWEECGDIEKATKIYKELAGRRAPGLRAGRRNRAESRRREPQHRVCRDSLPRLRDR